MITAVASWSTALTAQAFRLTAKVAVDKLRETEPDRISPYCEFDFKYGCSRRTDGCEGVAVTLSEYWICDHVRNEDCDPEYLIQRDAPLVQ